jgi:hypothetical protein
MPHPYGVTVTSSSRQNAHLTFKGNVGRHAWLRLTPAYSVRLVREHVARTDPAVVITDPFSGTGTTALAAAEHGARGQALDINPFLIWFGEAKTRHYDASTLARGRDLAAEVLRRARALLDEPGLWQPRLANISRWWPGSALDGLKALRAALDEHGAGPARDLLDIAFCRTLIETSNAAFDHQSMSFRDEPAAPPAPLEVFARESGGILRSAAVDLAGVAAFVRCDAREMDAADLAPCDLLLTSPPYVNRMSYIRELRPYMYWLRHLDAATDAAELDWTAIGGTWGVATSRLATWTAASPTPVDDRLRAVCDRIAGDGGKSGPLLANYVRKYFVDMWAHFQAAYEHVASGGRATYIIGNSTFYGHVVPAEEWYAAMLAETGFGSVTVTAIRKRNSKKELYEFEVTARKP